MSPRSVRPSASRAWSFSRTSWTRRRWLGTAASFLPALATRSWGQTSPKSENEKNDIEKVQDRAKKAGLGGFGNSSNDHFLSVGNASDRFRVDALRLSEQIGKDYLAQFQKRGFKVAYPAHRMTLVTLKDPDSFKRYIADDPEEVVGGQYELDTNQLVMFDLRGLQNSLNADAKRVNTFALVHETIHLLCFNTGLLSRKADVPRVVSEGLATYGEMWTPPRNPAAFGAVNRLRLGAIADALNARAPWISLDQLLVDDTLFDKPKTSQLAYGEAWLLTHYLLRQPRLPKFQAYLDNLPNLGEESRRVKYLEEHLGPLRTLDKDLRAYFRQVLRR